MTDLDDVLAKVKADLYERAGDGAGSGAEATFTFRTLRDWAGLYQPPRWLIRNFLMADAFDVLGGAEKSLKSWLMHHVAIALAAGVPLFGDETFDVPTPGTVLLLTGEGGVDLVLDRINHLCTNLYGIDADDVLDRIVVSSDIAPMTSAAFASDVSQAIATHDPLLVQLDPLYVYFGEDREAGNVFSTGPALAHLRQLTTGRALQVAHHFTKAAADRLTLASLTQAGMREAVDHWLLIAVREHDLVAQRFVLDLERGARRGLAWSRTAEVVLGPFDTETLRHVGQPRFEWVTVTGKQDRKLEDVLRRVCAFVHANPGCSTNALETGVSGTAAHIRGARDLLAGKGFIRIETGERRAQLHYPIAPYMTGPEEVDE
jgi:AAA domain